jgi:hypothetical protein
MRSDRCEKLDGRDEEKHEARWCSRGSCRYHRLRYLPTRERPTGSGNAAFTLREKECKTRRNFVVEGVCKGLLLCCIVTEA